MTLERDIADRWVREWLSEHPGDYWIRIPDSADGIKPFDGVLFRRGSTDLDHVAIAIEFKVWRLKRRGFDYSTVEPHQMMELLRFRDDGENGREALILVYVEHEKRWERYRPSRKRLQEIIGRRRNPTGKPTRGSAPPTLPS